MSIISHGGKDYDVPAYSVQDDSSAASLDSSKVPTGGTVQAVYGDPDTYMIKGTDYITAGKKANTTLGANATAEGLDTTASSAQAHAEGKSTVASGSSSHAEGEGCTANGLYAHAEGWHTTAGSGCHAEGSGSTASSSYSHAEGVSTTASEEGAHAEGYSSQATKKGSHSENRAYAQGEFSHAEGLFSKTKAAQAHAEGASTLASSENQHVQGKYNIEDANGIYAHIVGNGTNSSNRSNAHTLDWSGNAWFAGDVTDGSGNVLSDKADSDDISGSKSISGNPIIIEDSANSYAEEVIANIEPIQDLHGYDHPWVGGAGKNILPLTDESIKTASGVVWSGDSATFTGITWTINKDTDGNVIGITLNGTPTDEYSQITIARLDIDPGTYTFSGISDGSSETWWVRYVARDSSGTAISIDGSVFIDVYTIELTKTLPSNVSYVNAYIGTRVTISNKTFKPMIRLTTETDPTFEPYSNICSISGLNSVKVKRTGKNLLNPYIWKESKTIGTVTVTRNEDGSYTVAGNALSSPQWLSISSNNDQYLDANLPYGTYTISINNYSKFRFYINDESVQRPSDTTFTGVLNNIRIILVPNIAYNDTLKVQIELGSTASEYEPHISEAHTTSLPQTTYGGTLNVQTGELVVDRGYYKFDGSETWGKFNKGWGTTKLDGIIKSNINNATIANIISDIYIAITPNGSWSGSQGAGITVTIPSDNAKIRFYDSDLVDSNVSAVASHMSGHSICYELATPQTYHLTPEQVKFLKGYNHITTNADTLDITYQVDNVLGEILSESEGYTDRVFDGLTIYMKKGVDYVTAGKKANTTLGYKATAEGQNTTASGRIAHSEGATTTASGDYSHSEGLSTTASGQSAHAEGSLTEATASRAHAEGVGTKASSEDQHVEGKWNVEDSSDTYAHIIGGGTSDNARKNIFTVDWNGDVNAGRSNGLTNDTKLPTGADVISYLNSNLVPNTTRMVSLGSIAGTTTDTKTILTNAFNAINVYGTVITGSFFNAGIWIFIGYKYTGGQYGMLIATKYSSARAIYTLHVIDGTVYASSIMGTAL